MLNEEDVVVDVFFCKGSGENQNNLKLSHYAMNELVEPSSPNDVVLLFETDKGWNKHGGLEMLTTKHHDDKGCNILFNDGTVKFIKTTQIKSLRWK